MRLIAVSVVRECGARGVMDHRPGGMFGEIDSGCLVRLIRGVW